MAGIHTAIQAYRISNAKRTSIAIHLRHEYNTVSVVIRMGPIAIVPSTSTSNNEDMSYIVCG
jgi:hypothetical protein